MCGNTSFTEKPMLIFSFFQIPGILWWKSVKLNKQPLGSLVVHTPWFKSAMAPWFQTTSKSMMSGGNIFLYSIFSETILTLLDQSHLDLIALIYLLAEPCWRRKSHILERDLTLRLPTGTEEHTYTKESVSLSFVKWQYFTPCYILLCVCALLTCFQMPQWLILREHPSQRPTGNTEVK